MSSSASSPSKRALEDFVAGRLAADRLVAAVAGRYYGAAGRGEREALQPLLELAERTAPGLVSLQRRDGGAGFDVRVVERSFPAEALATLRGAAAAALAASWADSVATAAEWSAATALGPSPEPLSPARPGWFERVVSAVRQLFSAST